MVERLKLMMLLDMEGQYEHVEKKINRLGITNQKIQVFQYDIESA